MDGEDTAAMDGGKAPIVIEADGETALESPPLLPADGVIEADGETALVPVPVVIDGDAGDGEPAPVPTADGVEILGR